MDGGTSHSFGLRVKEAREKRGMTMEDLAVSAGVHRTAIGLIERGERDPTLGTALAIAHALEVPLQELLTARVQRNVKGLLIEDPDIPGITGESIKRAIERTYAVLDTIDGEMVERGYPRLAEAMELANLSAFIGNLFGAAIAEESGGAWVRNGPHKYPDLITPEARDLRLSGEEAEEELEGVEIKMALEKNRPKGHLAKAGLHLTVRWVLSHSDGKPWVRGERGDAVTIWEVKAGLLGESDFDISNTAGDSGKTATVSTLAFKEMKLVYFDRSHCAMARIEKYLREHGRQTQSSLPTR